MSNRVVALQVTGGGTTLLGADVTVSETLSSVATGDGGEAIEVSSGARVEIDRASVRRSRRGGLLAFHAGSSARLQDLCIEATEEADCGDDWCAGEAGGCAFAAFSGAALEARRFLLSRSALCGVQIVDAEMDLDDGEVSSNGIGANVQAPGFDIARIRDRVLYRDNGRDLDAAELPAPAPADGVDPAPDPEE